MKIYSPGCDKAATLHELLTILVSPNLRFNATFKDTAFTILECHGEARRSFNDIYDIVNTYLPDVTKKQLALQLTTNFRAIYCSHIHKVVFSKLGNLGTFGGVDGNCNNTDMSKKGVDNLSYNDILNLANEKKIYFKDGEKAKTLAELLEIGFGSQSRQHNNYTFGKTYFNKSLLKLECKSAYRSFPDLYEIACTYFPETTKSELATILTTKYYSIFCHHIKKVVFLNYSNQVRMYNNTIKKKKVLTTYLIRIFKK